MNFSSMRQDDADREIPNHIEFDAEKYERYVYSDLPNPTSIRLISGLRMGLIDGVPLVHVTGDRMLPVLCISLRTMDLDASPLFDCLSYTWGNPCRVFTDQNVYDLSIEYYSRKTPVLCDGKLLWIGRNLYLFLQRVLQVDHVSDDFKQEHPFSRLTGRDRADSMWIDSICINQKDLDERSQQVQIMDRIYSAANVVLAWLGEQDNFSKSALYDLTALAGLPDSMKVQARGINPVMNDLRSLGIARRITFEAVYAFLKRSWFRRAWIVQEAALARRLVIWCGGIQIPFDLLVLGAHFLFESGWWSAISSDISSRRKTGFGDALSRVLSASNIQEMAQLREAIQGGPLAPYESKQDIERNFDPIYAIMHVCGLRLALNREMILIAKVPDMARPTYQELFTSLRQMEATEPKDKVYAFLGLRHPNDAIARALIPDYHQSKTSQAVFAEAAAFVLQETSTLDFLAHREDIARGRDLSLPSWVPDLTTRIFDTIQGESVQPWSAAGSVPRYLSMNGARNGVLVLHGLMIDNTDRTASWDKNDLSRVQELLFELPRTSHIWYPSNNRSRSSVSSMDSASSTSAAVAADSATNVGNVSGISPSLPAAHHIHNRIEVLWRTLIADCCQNQHPAPGKYGFAFTPWLLNEIAVQQIAINQAKFSQQATGPVIEDKEVELNNALTSLIIAWQDEASESSDSNNVLEPVVDDGSGQQQPINYLREVPDFLKAFYSGDNKILQGETENEFDLRKVLMIDHRVLFTTSRRRYLGLGPQSLQPGDQFWLLAGAKVPHVLRPKENGRFELVGECYVHGIMHGEAARGRDDDFVKIEIEKLER